LRVWTEIPHTEFRQFARWRLALPFSSKRARKFDRRRRGARLRPQRLRPQASQETAKSVSTTTHEQHAYGFGGKTCAQEAGRGQQKIDSERAQAIQEALIREHYLTGKLLHLNQASEEAMRRYQSTKAAEQDGADRGR